jgi:hypothetical protein
MFTTQIKVVARGAFVAAGVLGVGALGVAAIAVGTPTAHAAADQARVGQWLGQALTRIGQCDPAVGEFTFAADGTYA